jgi:SHS2 domain-containing protein
MYEIFEHTADMGIRVRADSLDELFADAARGLFSVMVENIDAVQPVEETAFQLHGDDIEELLHDWLAELLFTFHARRIVLTEFHVRLDHSDRRQESPPTILTATARGEPIDPSRHEIDAEVKAITWCGLKVEHRPDGWLAEVIVDI